MRAINMSKFARKLRFKGRDVTLRLGDFTWADLSLYHQLSGGVELTTALEQGFNPRLLLPAIYIHDAKDNPHLTWEKFAATVQPFTDIELLLEERSDEVEEPAPKKGRRTKADEEAADPEA